jgi:hypothetical protein
MGSPDPVETVKRLVEDARTESMVVRRLPLWMLVTSTV